MLNEVRVIEYLHGGCYGIRGSTCRLDPCDRHLCSAFELVVRSGQLDPQNFLVGAGDEATRVGDPRTCPHVLIE
jgi:hypothetical protein